MFLDGPPDILEGDPFGYRSRFDISKVFEGHLLHSGQLILQSAFK